MNPRGATGGGVAVRQGHDANVGGDGHEYHEVTTVESRIEVRAKAPASVWVDVTWSYDAEPRERFCYQLIGEAPNCQIAVLTPLAGL